MTNNELRLFVALCADGYEKNKFKYVVRLKKKRKIKRLEKLLNKVGKHYTKSINNDYTVFHLLFPYRKGFPQHWYNLDAVQLSIIADECLYWDGNGKNTFYTTIKSQADFIQFAMTSSCDSRVSLKEYIREDKGHTEYRVIKSKSKQNFQTKKIYLKFGNSKIN